MVARISANPRGDLKLTYDPKANAAYIQLYQRHGDVRTTRITENFLVDMDEHGNVVGIELLNANEQIGGCITAVNTVSEE